MPTLHHGRNTKVYVNDLDATAYFNSSDAGKSRDTAESSTFGTDDKTYEPGMREGSLSLAGFYDKTDAVAAQDVWEQTLEDPTTKVSVIPGGLVEGALANFMEGNVEQFDLAASSGGLVSTSLSVKAEGGHILGRVLHDDASVGAATSSVGAVHDDGAAIGTTTRGFKAVAHVLANAATAASTIEFEHSVDNAVWVSLGTINVPAGETGGYALEATGDCHRYLRATVTAGAGGAVQAVALGGRL